MKVKKLAIIGCGAAGTEIACKIDSGIFKNIKLHSLYDINQNKVKSLNKKLKHSNPVLSATLREALSKCNVIIESAKKEVVKEIISLINSSNKKLIIMSTGSFLTFPYLVNSSKRNNIHILLPSGAIAGLDAIKAASMGKISNITLTTRKPPKSFGILNRLLKPKIIYKGMATNAVKLFPANINVAATIALSGIGADNTKVKIIADPSIKLNIHEIEVSGNFGKIITRTENKPSKMNPKTSFLAILSVLSELKKIDEE